MADLPTINRPLDEVQELGVTPGVPALGSRYRDGGNEYIFCRGVASLAVGDVVTINHLHACVRLADAGKGRVGVAMGAANATTHGCWVQIYGTHSAVKAVAGTASNSALFSSSTAGSVQSDTSSGNQLKGILSRSAVASGVIIAEINYPVKDN